MLDPDTADAADELASFAAQFHHPRRPDDGDPQGRRLIYLCGHSLGLQPVTAADYVASELADWSRRAVLGHTQGTRPWIAYHEAAAAPLARLAGALESEVVAMNSLTVNLHLMMVSFFRPAGPRRRVLMEASAFPSDRYAVVSQLEFHGLDPKEDLIELGPRDGEHVLRTEDLVARIEREGPSLALVLLPGVQYLTGQCLELPAVIAAARAAGARVGLDLAHAIGNTELHLHDWNADFAVWCSYKYLNAGPGAVGGCFVHARHARGGLPRFAGWWGHDKATRFAMPPQFEPIAGAEGWQVSNPPVLALAPLLASLELFDAAGTRRLIDKSRALTGFLQASIERLGDAVDIITPSNPAARGCQLSLRIRRPADQARRCHEALLAAGVVGDWREPDVLRLAPVPLYNSFADVAAAAAALAGGAGLLMTAQPLSIVGAGPTGALLAILLKRRGLDVSLYDSRSEIEPPGAGRSINLALAARGIRALELAGVYAAIRDAAIPMRGRMLHDGAGQLRFLPYGRRPHEHLLSLSRSRLNRALLDVARRRHGVPVHFGHRLKSADFTAGTATLETDRGRLIELPMRPLLASDGAGSRMRRCMAEQGFTLTTEVALQHGYKELSIPAGPAGEYRLEREALHIWPRGDHMLIALPNEDGSFTATLFLPNTGAVSFAALDHAAAIEDFLQGNFPDACELMPERVNEFQRHPTGFLGTVYASPWHHAGMTALIGDAAHAIVPFHGQGMNCCFEDCVEFDAGLDRHDTWQGLFADFEARRKPNTDAIAAMALENYAEMREHVADPRFRLRQALALALEEQHPRRFIPRYSMVTFHPEIPYRVAMERGAVQAQLLQELTAGCSTLAEVDFARAAREIEARLPSIAPG